MAKNETVPQINEVSRISLCTEIKGSLISQSDIRIDGTFEGDLITSGKLVLGENATIRGNIMCQSADIWGKIVGEFNVGDTTSFKSSASFTGNLKTVRISIEIGAVFNGNCQIIDEAMFKSMSAEYFR